MSKIYFSGKKLGYFIEDLMNDYKAAGTLPDDLIELTPSEIEEYQGKQPPEGKTLGSDVNGRPLWVESPPPTEEDLKQQRIAELKQFLSDTDHKALNDYTPKEGEDMDKVHADRIAARDEIRTLEAE